MLAVESIASWMKFFSGMYGMGGQLRPAFRSHSWGLSPLGAALLWLVVLSAEPSAMPMKRNLKKVLGVLVTDVDGLCPSKRSVAMTCELLLVGSRRMAGGDGGVEGIIGGNCMRRSHESAIVR